MASSSVGISSSDALIVVQARPPNLGTAKVYGILRKEPMRLGTAVSRNSSGTERVIPTLPRFSTTIVHSTQMLNPMCSANTDHARFLRAMRLPVCSQNSSFSGSQWSIQRPREDGRAAFGSRLGASSGAWVRVLMGSPGMLREGRGIDPERR